MSDDREFMARSIELARRAARRGDSPFGSVLVDSEGKVVAEGQNREVSECDVSWHAEMAAIRNATRSLGTRDLNGMTIYASGEPCIMCSFAIRRTGISRVVVGARSATPPPPGAHPLRDEDFGDTPVPEFTFGVLEDEALAVQGRKPR
ncbi:MAG: nucleoside deaminase [Clostridia bacterium]